jgi:hypothetical protein
MCVWTAQECDWFHQVGSSTLASVNHYLYLLPNTHDSFLRYFTRGLSTRNKGKSPKNKKSKEHNANNSNAVAPAPAAPAAHAPVEHHEVHNDVPVTAETVTAAVAAVVRQESEQAPLTGGDAIV